LKRIIIKFSLSFQQSAPTCEGEGIDWKKRSVFFGGRTDGWVEKKGRARLAIAGGDSGQKGFGFL
jgi:hypothetical protein